ncbi:MAG: glycoside hydrolase family 92 protein [Planctomycetia bacterium]|nr:glycoside hydrolase family 92 protein [Planctomycetia bacterium]
MPSRLLMIVVSGWALLSTARAVEGAPPALPTSVQPGDLGRWVNPFVGTGGITYLCGNNFPGATVPFGMVRLSPDTVSSTGRRAANTSGYYYGDERILGFSHTRLSGTGAVDGGNFLVVPSIAPFAPKDRQQGLDVRYSHDKETAFPGYYAVVLPEPGILAELTATRRVGVHRYTFPEGQTPHLRIHATSALGKGRSSEGEVRVLPTSREVEGAVRTFGTFSGRHGGHKIYFVARVSQPFAAFGTWKGDAFSAGQDAAAGDEVGADLTFENAGPQRTVELKLAISYASIKNARANLESEVGEQDFDQVLAKAKEQWEERLSLVRLEGGTDQQRAIFYTGLYHSFLMPTVFNDANGEYVGFDGQVHQASGFTYYTDMSLWDTFRTVHPLYTLIAPREQRDMVVSLVEMAKQGGYLPRWPSGTGYTNSMFGTPADMVVAEAYLKGIRDFDVETAYQAMRKTALGPTPPDSPFSGRKGIEDYLKFEYCPSDLMSQAVSRTLEYCYADHAVARLAEALGHSEDAALFDKHAQYYRNLWNPETQYFQPRDSQGQFVEFRPLLLTYVDLGKKYTDDYVEGSALQWRWAVSFDAAGLISLFKSREYFVEELDEFFAKSEPGVGLRPNAYYWHGNQPDIYAAYLFNAAGRPDLTQKWVRWILDKKYGDKENGLDGNDDGGTLSAWYVLSSLGLYPTAGSDRYQLASPLWQRAEIMLGGHRLTVVADNYAPAHPYVQKVRLNDRVLDRTWVKHGEIAQGGALRFEMGSEPAPR